MKTCSKKNSIAILGIGNLLMKDDGLGVHMIGRLQTHPPQGADLYEIGTSILKMQDLLEEYPVILVVDAVQTGAAAGTIVCLEGNSLKQSEGHSLHDIGIADVLSMIPAAKRPYVVILGVEPAEVDLGMELSATVQAVLPKLENRLREILEDLSQKTKHLLRCKIAS